MIQNKKIILVVDDECDIRLFIRLCLELEYCIIEANNGEDALETLNQSHPDLVILDVKMPEVDGFSVCSHMRREPKLANIPIILMSGVETGLDAKLMSFLNIKEYLVKPFSKLALLNAVVTSLNGSLHLDVT